MSDFAGRMAALRRRFAERGPEEVARIEAGLARGDWADLREASHGLAGRAGMFGYRELGDTARVLEDAIDAGAPEAELRACAAALADALRGLG